MVHTTLQEPSIVKNKVSSAKNVANSNNIAPFLQQLQQLEATISAEPTVNPTRVEAAITKMQSGQLGIGLSAQETASKILAVIPPAIWYV